MRDRLTPPRIRARQKAGMKIQPWQVPLETAVKAPQRKSGDGVAMEGAESQPVVVPAANTARECLVSFEVPGEPTAKGRGRVGVNRGTGRAQVFTPEKTRTAERSIRQFAADAMAGTNPFDGPLALIVTAYRAKGMPKSKAGHAAALAGHIAPTTKPDGDNYLKAACDACNGVVWVDDALIVDMTIRKRYSDRPRLEIELRRWTVEVMG